MKVTILFALLCTSLATHAQQGTLKGKVQDQKTGEAVIGAVVFIAGSNTAAATDYNGEYTLKLDPGLYKIAVSYVSYKQQTIENVQVNPNKTTELNISIEEAATSLNTVSIVGTRQTNTDLNLISEIRKSEVVVSGVSGEQITKSLDRDAAETVKRIPGVTIMNDRYIVIRGMNERYNSVMLNDALTPSTEPDSRAFSFDILPTSVIDRILIYKNGSPELPGDFGGGVIKIYSKNFADENGTRLGLATSFRSNTTFHNFLTAPDNQSYFYNPDYTKKELPSGFPANLNTVGNADRLVAYGKQLPNTWTPLNNQALPDLRLNLGVTRLINIGQARLSNLTSVSYSNTRTFTEGTRNKYQDFDPTLGRSPKDFSYQDRTFSHNMRLGVLHNWTARFNNNNKVVFSNLFNQMGVSEVLMREGFEYFNGLEQRNYALRNESRTIYAGQFQGTHDLNNEKTTFTWTGGYSYTNRNEPDYRRLRTQRDIGSGEPFAVAFKQTPSLADAGRFYSELSEHVLTGAGQVEHRFNPADSLSENAPKIRAGFYVERKNRGFDARFFSYRPADPGSFNQALPFQPLDLLFAPQHINPSTGIAIVEGTSPSDSYTASNMLVAGFLSGSAPLSDRLSVSGGVRMEYNNQYLESKNLLGRPYIFEDKVLRPLPSLNLTYAFTQRSMLRAGGSISLNRPQFREVAPFAYYNFITLFEEKGAPLRTATIYNADLRYEFYPTPTELISVGVFGKYFIDPIEKYFEVTNIGNSLSFINARYATSYGAEVEVRKSLLDLTESSFLQRFSLLLNGSLIRSEVVMPEELAANQDRNRPMMGQSPYVVNTGLYYHDDTHQLQATLLYNVVGRRIFAVGSYANPTVYDMPRNVLDLSVTKGLGSRLELKAGVQDLLNQPIRLIQDSNRDGKITGTDESIQQFRRGSYSTVGLTYKF